MAIKNWKEQLRPREKAYHQGISSLSDSELLAIIIRSGTKEENAIQLAQNILNETNGFSGLANLSIEECTRFKGIGLAKATELACCLELVKRIKYQNVEKQDVFKNPKLLVDWLKKEIGMEQQEYLLAVFLDNHCRIKGHKIIFKGVYNSVSFDAKTIFNAAIKENAHSIILAHNHPSQFSSPSMCDDMATMDLANAGKLIGIPVDDHIIITFDDYYSYRQHGLLK